MSHLSSDGTSGHKGPTCFWTHSRAWPCNRQIVQSWRKMQEEGLEQSNSGSHEEQFLAHTSLKIPLSPVPNCRILDKFIKSSKTSADSTLVNAVLLLHVDIQGWPLLYEVLGLGVPLSLCLWWLAGCSLFLLLVLLVRILLRLGWHVGLKRIRMPSRSILSAGSIALS